MPIKGTDEWKATYCDRRFHPPYLTGLPYWFFCRLEPGHAGDCDCEGAHEAAAEQGVDPGHSWLGRG